jgi:hypothetical protein
MVLATPSDVTGRTVLSTKRLNSACTALASEMLYERRIATKTYSLLESVSGRPSKLP